MIILHFDFVLSMSKLDCGTEREMRYTKALRDPPVLLASNVSFISRFLSHFSDKVNVPRERG